MRSAGDAFPGSLHGIVDAGFHLVGKVIEAIDPYDLSVKIMQSYANFTVGGTLSVNAHGRRSGIDVNDGTFTTSNADDVDATGEIKTVDLDNNDISALSASSLLTYVILMAIPTLSLTACHVHLWKASLLFLWVSISEILPEHKLNRLKR